MAAQTTKWTVFITLVLVLAGCALIRPIREAIIDAFNPSQSPAAEAEAIFKEWGRSLGISTSEMLRYVVSSDTLPSASFKDQRIQNAAREMSPHSPEYWVYIAAAKPELRGFDRDGREVLARMATASGSKERPDYRSARQSLWRILNAMQSTREVYKRTPAEEISGWLEVSYNELLKTLGGPTYAGLDRLFSQPEGPFVTEQDQAIWRLIAQFLRDFRGMTSRGEPELQTAFDGVRADMPLDIVERIRITPLVYRILLIGVPAHEGIENLLKTLEAELPPPTPR